jgi:hypothetical protein
MSVARVYGRFPSFVIGALALVAALAYCPSASAACGDYVTVVGAGVHPPSADAPGSPSPAPTCHGPGCSKAPSQAAPVSAPKMVERPAPPAVGGAESVPPPPGVPGYPRVESPSPSSRHPSDIFHPPRAA